MGLLLPDLNESPFLQSAIPNGIRPSPTSPAAMSCFGVFAPLKTASTPPTPPHA